MAFTTQVELFNRPGKARVERPIQPDQQGRVFYGGTYWPARFYDSAEFVNTEVASQLSVVGRQGITLLVAPLMAAVCNL
ncbi:hypothetical protein C7271_10725 [filamentous cyanobacterium CCP5]|nr:hypothetical protein C7271_10725 [filamentous cyanobacterium CCP5]